MTDNVYELKIFWQPNCPKCVHAKELGEQLKEKIKITLLNVKEANGLADSLFYEVMSTPSLVLLKNSKELKVWRGESPTIEDVQGILDG